MPARLDAFLSRSAEKLFRLSRHRYGTTLAVYLVAAAATGVTCVVFMRLFERVHQFQLGLESLGRWNWALTPILFWVAYELIQRFAPQAAGTGIPQAIFAAGHLTPESEPRLKPLVSMRTLTVKIFTILVALAGGASLGREGPTVQVGVCVFIWILGTARRVTKLPFDLRSGVVAGGAAGLAAAFNTPLAGVTFAIEELTVDHFPSIKDFVLIAIIVAALAAKTLTGEYGYFGRLVDPQSVPLLTIVLIGLAGGVLGAFFSESIHRGQRWWASQNVIQSGRWRTLFLSGVLMAITTVAGTRILGPGNAAAKELLSGAFGSWAFGYPFAKIGATLATYWAGMPGGIFAPCLSVGAGLGASMGHLLGTSTAACAIVGMAAFLSGAIQAPITSFVIIFEMSGHHDMLLPVMLASLLAFMTARLLGAAHLYSTLSRSYENLLGNPRS